tara:strand:+ start:516 stop:1622 length:1107 start_codon:yes stop_codon:yes gene_type:complete
MKNDQKILIVGNGSITHDENDYYVNKYTGEFLQNFILNFSQTTYCEILGSVYDKDSNLKDFGLVANGVQVLPIHNSGFLSKFVSLGKLIFQVKNSDHVHFFLPGTLTKIGLLICWFFRRKYSVYLRGDLSFNSIFIQHSLRKAVRVLTVSNYFVDLIKKFNSNVAQIAPMLPLTLNDVVASKNVDTFRNFLFVGRIENDKGIRELVSLSAKLDQFYNDYTLNLVGGGPEINAYRTVKDNEYRSPNLIYHGFISNRSQLKSFYETADAFIFPTYHEGFPRVLYEAMAKGLPIITTGVGGIPALMIHENNCLMIDKESVDSLYDAITRLEDNFHLRRQISFGAVSSLKEFLTNDMVPHYLNLVNIVNDEF